MFLAGAAPATTQPRAAGEDLAAAVESECVELGARVWRWRAVVEAPEADPSSSELTADEAIADALAAAESIEVAVVDAASMFACALGGEARDRRPSARAALMVSLEASWNITRALVNIALLPKRAGGRIVYLAPAGGSHEHADVALPGMMLTAVIAYRAHSIDSVRVRFSRPARAASACSCEPRAGAR